MFKTLLPIFRTGDVQPDLVAIGEPAGKFDSRLRQDGTDTRPLIPPEDADVLVHRSDETEFVEDPQDARGRQFVGMVGTVVERRRDIGPGRETGRNIRRDNDVEIVEVERLGILGANGYFMGAWSYGRAESHLSTGDNGWIISLFRQVLKSISGPSSTRTETAPRSA